MPKLIQNTHRLTPNGIQTPDGKNEFRHQIQTPNRIQTLKSDNVIQTPDSDTENQFRPQIKMDHL